MITGLEDASFVRSSIFKEGPRLIQADCLEPNPRVTEYPQGLGSSPLVEEEDEEEE